jgi:UDP-N-acetylglucosamine transferase subunit ALG13
MIRELGATDEVVAQIGETPEIAAPGMQCVQYMSYNEIRAHMRAAQCVICHAGVGTILTALDLGHTPIVVPRLQARGEHVDDHQLQLATQLSGRGLILCYRDGDSLEAMVETAKGSRSESQRGGDALGAEIARDVAQALTTPGYAVDIRVQRIGDLVSTLLGKVRRRASSTSGAR